MACQVPPLDKLTNGSPVNLSISQLATQAAGAGAAELATALNIAIIVDVELAPTPIAPFIWAATAIALGVEEFISLFGGGRPKDQDTNNVIWAYHMSGFWPLQALGTDLAIALKNGAPISDSRPAIQAQFSAWKRGTIESIQQLAGWPPGQQSPGYWQLAQLIDTSWAFSKNGQQAVLSVVKAIDCFTEVLAALHKAQPTPKPPPPAPPPPAPLPGPQPCESSRPDQDEQIDSCQATQVSLNLILQAIQGLNLGGLSLGSDQCCTNVVQAIVGVTRELTVIATALANSASPAAPVDLTAIVTSLNDLVVSVAAYPPALEACCTAITTQLSAIATALGPDLGKVIQNIADAINKGTAEDLLPAAMVDEMVKNGSMPAPIAQFFSDRPASWSISGLISGIGHFVTGGINPDLGKEVSQNLKDNAAGRPDTYQPIHSLLDVVVALVMNVGYHWAHWGSAASGLLKPAVEQAFGDLGAALQAADPSIGTDIPLAIGWPATAAIRFVMSAPAKGEVVTSANYNQVAQDAFGRAALCGFVAYGVAMVSGWLFGPFAKGMEEVAALVALGAGFEEISERWLGPFLDAVIHNRAVQDANQKWPTRVPPFAQALALLSRRKIDDTAAETLLGYGGLDPDWRPAMKLGAYRPVTPFVLASAFVDQPIDRATLLDILQDNAYSDSHANTMADAIVYKSIGNVRNSYLSAAISGYQKGVIGDQELGEVLTEFNFAPLAKKYVTNHVLILRREVLLQKTQSQVVPLVEQGLLTPDEGLQQLEAAGMQPWLAQLEITLAETKATIMMSKKEAAAERKLEIERQRNLTRVATAEFERGVIDTVGLTAALIALGLDPTLVASIVAVQDATRAGRLRLVYGQLLAPQDAKLLTERVAAIAQQTKDQLITLDQAYHQLIALQVDKEEAQALIARWAAGLKKSAGAAILVQP